MKRVSNFPVLFLSEIVAAEGNMRPIFCGNFEYDARQSDLERLFRKFGRVERVDMKSGFSWDLMEELLRVLFHACDKHPLLAF
ncbi:hypothetical protein V6N13_035435 [Hibiscus sabdariffa]